MGRFNIKTKRKSAGYAGLVIGVACIISLSVFPYLNGPVFAKSDETGKTEFNVFTRTGRPIGSVDKAGRVFNRSGRLVGSVDRKGTIFNISEHAIGKAESSGKVLNRLGTMVGSVDNKGNVFDNNERKIGSVKSPVSGDIILIGGAAWLLLFRAR